MSEIYPLISLREVALLDPDSTLLLSVNNRHARRILGELTALLGAGRQVMAVPDILPLGVWLGQAADHLSFIAEHEMAAHTADGFGAQYLWRRVIDDCEADQVLLDVAQASRLAADADRLLDEWRIDVQPDEETTDYQRFLTWRDHYRRRLDELDLEDGNLAYERVCRAVSDGSLHLPVKHVVLAGFNEVSPRLRQLLQALQEQGASLHMLGHAPRPAPEIQRIQAGDNHAEWLLAAQWARDQLLQHPEGRFAIVVPRLEASVARAHRVLSQTLEQHDLVFNIAIGRPLSEWPLVRAALAWLRVMVCFSRNRPCAADELGAALLAGACAGHTQEASARALLDARLRRHGVIHWSEAHFADQLSQRAPRLGEAWPLCMEIVRGHAGTQALGGWSRIIRAALQALGFPGDAALDSHAYQTLDAFDQLIERLNFQSPVTGKVGFGTAVSLLAQMAHETLFQPQRDPHSRLDVLGFLESEGGRWDGVWVLGLTDDVLPAAPQPNPLIPLSALRRVNAPRATPERELQWAQSIFDALLASAPRVWLSYPAQEGERQLRPSPCIAALPELIAEPDHPLPETWDLECIVDNHGPALPGDRPTRGGIALIDAQARNPLWAFAKFRLGASELPDYAILADQSVRGIFLHRAMEVLWKMLGGQDALGELMLEHRLDGLLEHVTEQAADECLREYSPVLRELEVRRARQILLRWLDLEMQREPFTVMAVEQRERWAYSGLELSLQLDRVDRLADGRLAVIDYKSGANPPDPRHSWVRERPVDLQLPLYAAVLNRGDGNGVAALIQAILHARNTDTVGVSDGDCGLNGIAHFTSWEAFEGLSWGQVLENWQSAIHTVADEFARGWAANTSVNADDLKFCDVLPFLRLNEEYPCGDETAN